MFPKCLHEARSSCTDVCSRIWQDVEKCFPMASRDMHSHSGSWEDICRGSCREPDAVERIGLGRFRIPLLMLRGRGFTRADSGKVPGLATVAASQVIGGAPFASSFVEHAPTPRASARWGRTGAGLECIDLGCRRAMDVLA